MHSTIEQIAARIETLKRQNAVLSNCLEAYKTGLIRPKEEVLFYAEAMQGVGGGLIRLEIPAEYVGRRFRIVLEREQVLTSQPITANSARWQQHKPTMTTNAPNGRKRRMILLKRRKTNEY